MVILLFGIMFALIIFGVPIGFSILAAAAAALNITGMRTPLVIAQRMIYGIDSFSLLAIPLFLLMGEIMVRTSLARRLVNWIKMFVANLTGGMGNVTIVASAFFAALTGSGPATVSAIGGIMIPAMEENGYSKRDSAGIAACAGALGPIIPPSIPMIIYGTLMGVNIAHMFIGGVVPGIAISFLLCCVNVFLVKKRKTQLKMTQEKYTLNQVFLVTIQTLPIILLPVVILGGIYGGIFTPTEAGGVGVVYCIILSASYGDLNVKKFIDILIETSKSAGSILLITAASNAFSWVLSVTNTPAIIADTIAPLLGSQGIFICALLLIVLVLGCIMDTLPAIYIFAPILVPIGVSLGCDPLHLAVFYCIVLVVGFITPPVGINLFVASRVARIPFEETVKGCLPYLIVLLVFLVVLAFVPEIITFLPNLMK